MQGVIRFIRAICKILICQVPEIMWLWNAVPAKKYGVLLQSDETRYLWLPQHVIFTRSAVLPRAHMCVELWTLGEELPSTWWRKLAKDSEYPLEGIQVKRASESKLEWNEKVMSPPIYSQKLTFSKIYFILTIKLHRSTNEQLLTYNRLCSLLTPPFSSVF